MTGDLPVGYQDLVEVWFVGSRAPKIVRLDTHVSPHSALDNTEKVMITRRREVSRNPGKVSTGDCGLAAYSGRSRENPHCRIS